MTGPGAEGETCVSVRVTGRVQGVSFRAWTADRARALGARGWVRNRGDGSVEALIAGDRETVRALLRELESGPAVARVDAVDAKPADAAAPTGFEIRG